MAELIERNSFITRGKVVDSHLCGQLDEDSVICRQLDIDSLSTRVKEITSRIHIEDVPVG